MDIESHESALLLKESSPKRRQGLALKLAVMLCGLALLVNLNGPTDTNIGVTFSSNKEEKKVTAAAGVSSLSTDYVAFRFPEHRLTIFILILPPLPTKERPQRLRRRKRRPRGGHEVVPAQPRLGRDQVRLSPSPKIPSKGRADGSAQVGPEPFRGRRPQRADRGVRRDRRGCEQIVEVLARTI